MSASSSVGEQHALPHTDSTHTDSARTDCTHKRLQAITAFCKKHGWKSRDIDLNVQSDSINCALWSAPCLKIAARYLTKDVDEDFGSWMRQKLASQGVCDLRSCPQAKDQNERFIQRIRTGAHKQLKQLALTGDAGNHLVS